MANPTLLTQPFAANGDKNIIPNTTTTQGAFSQDKGFPAECSLPLGAGGVAPSRQDFNGAFNMLSQIAFYAQKGYFWHWDASQEYFVGCVVIDDTDDNMYQCIQDVAAGGSVPSANATNWKKFSRGGGSRYVGEILLLSAEDAEAFEGILKADGAELLRTMYPGLNALYAAQGYPWGDGDGSTTFNLPNLIGKFPEGAKQAGGYHEAGLPNIEGALLIPYVVVFTDATPNSALVDMTQYDQNLAGKANRSLTNVDANIDFVVDSYRDAEGNWYRVYKSGWVEQGGRFAVSVGDTAMHTYLKPYTSNPMLLCRNEGYITITYQVSTTPTTFTTVCGSSAIDVSWYACGQGVEA